MTDIKKVKSIAVLTSGGDAPGMNCAIRSVVRTAIHKKLTIWGIEKGYAGLLEGNMRILNSSDVGNILQRGGTILRTSRCPEFHDPKIRLEGYHILKRKNVDGLIVIGGDGSFNGAYELYKQSKIPIIGIPGTIDNDISGTDYTIGFDTAVQGAMEAVDKIRDTASSHDRIFIVEVMGKKSASIAIQVAICTGAENIISPKDEVDYDSIVKDIIRGSDRGKKSSIIIVAEGKVSGRSYHIQERLKKDYNLDAHVCILGHTQRGGSPSSTDRFVAAQMGNIAVKALIKGESAKVTTMNNGSIELTSLIQCINKRKISTDSFTKLVKTLSI
jgi:6-phosphofructokinase 1